MPPGADHTRADDPSPKLKQLAAQEARQREADEERQELLRSAEVERDNLRYYGERAGMAGSNRGLAEQIARYLAAVRAAGVGERFDALRANDNAVWAGALDIYHLCDRGGIDAAAAKLDEAEALGPCGVRSGIIDALKRTIPDAISTLPAPKKAKGIGSGASPSAAEPPCNDRDSALMPANPFRELDKLLTAAVQAANHALARFQSGESGSEIARERGQGREARYQRLERLRGETIRAAEAAGLPFPEVRQVLDEAEDWMRSLEDWRPRGEPDDASEALADRTTAYRQVIESLWEMRDRLDGRRLAGAPGASNHAGPDPSLGASLSVETPPTRAFGGDTATDRSEAMADPTDPRYDIPFHLLNPPPPPPGPVPLHRGWLEPYPENAEALWQWCMRRIEEIRRAKGEADWLLAGMLAMAAVDDVVRMMKALGVPLASAKPQVPDPAAPRRSAEDAIQFLAECAGQCKRVTPQAESEAATPAPQQGAAATGGTTPRVAQSKTPRQSMRAKEANASAMELAKADRFFVQRSLREWAEAIGCSEGLVVKLPLWRETMKQTGRGKEDATAVPKVVSLTDHVQAISAEGTRDEVVHRLVDEEEACRKAGRKWQDLGPEEREQILSEQRAEDDQAESGPRKVRTRKRL